ncbi:MAG: protease [Chitinophagales bacterium]|nr:MAG: protease [Chitinophagales bacterium]
MNKEIKILQLVHDAFEDLELWYPVYRLQEYGAVVHLIGEQQDIYTGKHGVPAKAEYAFGDVNPEFYDAILVPGGWAPDKLRRKEDVLHIIKSMDAEKKLIGTICHGGWVLISAGIVRGRRITGTPAIKDDLMNAGAQWVDEPAVRDENIISAQRPPDLPRYMHLFIAALNERFGTPGASKD